ncbi:MAG: carotenoid biosynthesis protein [Acidobacteria bacterium]|nr:carotenoid biosynthesis protein [Acidobacteriota bacterium]
MKISVLTGRSRSVQFALLILLPAYLVMWLGGLVNYMLVGHPPVDAPWAASLFLFLAGLVVLLTSASTGRINLILAALIGLFAEMVGVRYGFLFSPYSYTSVLVPQLHGVPLVMLFAWMVLVAYTWQLWTNLFNYSTGGFPFRRILVSLIGAGWMTAIDLLIDPLAANNLGYWRWVESSPYYGIPYHNFAGWFLVSFFIFIVIPPPREQNQLATPVGLSIVIFFTTIALALKLWIAGLVGIALVLIDLYFRSRPRR